MQIMCVCLAWPDQRLIVWCDTCRLCVFVWPGLISVSLCGVMHADLCGFVCPGLVTVSLCGVMHADLCAFVCPGPISVSLLSHICLPLVFSCELFHVNYEYPAKIKRN